MGRMVLILKSNSPLMLYSNYVIKLGNYMKIVIEDVFNKTGTK